MTTREETLEYLEKLLIRFGQIVPFPNQADTRNVTLDSICQATQNAIFSLKLASELENVDFYHRNGWNDFSPDDFKDVVYNYLGFIKDALYNRVFMAVETHLRTIAKHYDDSKNTCLLNENIRSTFHNLMTNAKSPLKGEIKTEEISLFCIYLYLRNTQHNFGKQTKKNQSVNFIHDESMFFDSPILLELKEGKFNELDTKRMIYLIEQVVLIIQKIDSRIPASEFIEHPLVSAGYNNQC